MRSLLTCVLVFGFAVGARGEDKQLDSLIKQLKSTDSDLRREAAKKLGELGPDAREAGSALISALKSDKDLFVRRFAAQSLGDIGADPKLAVPALSAVMKEDVKELTEAAVGSLGKMGAPAVTALSDLLKSKTATTPKKGDKKGPKAVDHTAFLRSKAAQALGDMGSAAKPAVPALVTALKDASVRTDAVVALGKIGPAAKDALGPLKDLQGDKGAKKDKAFTQAVRDAIRKIEKS